MLFRKLFNTNAKENKVIVLMYHRIASMAFDPWDLCVDPLNFKQQVEILEKKYKVISTRQLNDYLEGASLPYNAVCLTFDDGYTDNATIARPVIEQYKIPVTFFIPDYYIENGACFWWDELTEIFFSRVEADAALREKWRNWKWPQPAPDQVCQDFILAWEKLRPLPYTEIKKELAKLRENHGADEQFLAGYQPMTKKQLGEAGKTGLISLAVHTSTHPALDCHPAEIQKSEIAANVNCLRKYAGAETDTIAYPYGAYNDTTLEVVKALDFKMGFTTKAVSVRRDSPKLQLGRFQVKNWNGKEFNTQLENWFKNY
ncbi:polysaccharide deacetylase family protein [Flavihumibacter profundi]|uniref:polysaccharide deacetylase family protein n=1 Tax=Flavihumibacter profundi TaxID=2716883 RepID=UPI001CC55F79|nr:polysaccharide deacetylase family protein [Flavihumibacter profundi]MBZ5858028.1 polysaccharide deacetylase family protein [Flavihumibacter profundi]